MDGLDVGVAAALPLEADRVQVGDVVAAGEGVDVGVEQALAVVDRCVLDELGGAAVDVGVTGADAVDGVAAKVEQVDEVGGSDVGVPETLQQSARPVGVGVDQAARASRLRGGLAVRLSRCKRIVKVRQEVLTVTINDQSSEGR